MLELNSSWPNPHAHGSDETVDPQQAQAYADDCLAGGCFFVDFYLRPFCF